MKAHPPPLQFHKQYPFANLNQSKTYAQSTQARQYIPLNLNNRLLLKQKLHILQSLESEYLIRPIMTFQSDHHLEIVFEYISEGLQNGDGLSSNEMVESVRLQLTLLAQRLTQYSIQHSFRLQNIGISVQKNLKYFLGLNFSISQCLSRENLMAKYCRNIDEVLLQKINNDFQEEIRRTSHPNQGPQTPEVRGKASQVVKGSLKIVQKSLSNANVDIDPILTRKPQGLQQFKSTSSIAKLQLNEQENSPFYIKKTSQLKFIKVEELGNRINKLKECMKEMLGRTPPKYAGLTQMLVRIDSKDPTNRVLHQNNLYISPNYTKFQKKIAEFRQNQLIRAERQQALISQNNPGCQLNGTSKQQRDNKDNKILVKKSPKKEISIHSRLSHHVSKKQDSPTVKEPLSPKSADRQLHYCFTSATVDDQRKLKQYCEFASKDKYCEEFMHFLEDNHPESYQESQRVKIFSASQSRVHSTTNSNKSIKSNICSPEKKEREVLDFVSTEGSERSVSELQIKIQKVIRNSMKIIKSIKGKDSYQRN